MQENVELVQKGFRILLRSLSGYVGQEMNRVYRNAWWEEVRIALSDQRDILYAGAYDELIDSLDVLNCIRILDRKWRDVFQGRLSLSCRIWANELKGIRNIVSHLGQQDLDQPTAERALNTMVLLCKEIDEESAEDIEELYRNVRMRANEYNMYQPVAGVVQPESVSNRGALEEGSLLQLVGTDMVQKTDLTRKVTFGGKTETYPVYRVRLDALYYNDQNDRISTWITQYESENGQDSLKDLNKEIHNRIIENFICESNPEAIQRTQKNIELVGQREPGVALADGRIVDGNRRYTCLRKIQRNTSEHMYFETVIMDLDIHADRKQIKLLELAIQHGEEKKVDYDLIDYAIGTYRDVVTTKLLTVEEYAASANEAVSEVKKRIEIAEIISEFLTHIKLPEQYHIAREYQVYSLFQEMMAPLRKLEDDKKAELKKIAFNNAIMKAMPDQRKFIRDIKNLINKEVYEVYFKEQAIIGDLIRTKLEELDIHDKLDIDKFAEENATIAEDLKMSMEKAMQRYRSQELKNKPTEIASKCFASLMEIDIRNFRIMSLEEKEELKAQLQELENTVKKFKQFL